MLVHIKKILQPAIQGKYAIGAFNTFNLETTLAIARAAVKQKSPVIIQVTESTIKYAGLKNIFSIIKNIAENEEIDVPIAIHLDHGKTISTVKKCIKLGFSSVHFDGSELTYKKNLTLTRRMAHYGHQHKVWVQGELGQILSSKNKLNSDPAQFMTDPNQAQEFVTQTKIDTFAPSVGALHGMYKGKEKLNQALIKKISNLTQKPLVLHGASGVSNTDIKTAIKNGVRIINIATRLQKEFASELRQTLKEDPHEIDPREILAPEMDTIQKAVEEKIKLFGSNGVIK